MATADRTDKTGAAPARHARGFRRAGHFAKVPLGRAAARQGFAEAGILTRWDEIVGAALAPLCRPVRVRYASKRALGATLVVEAEGARAPEVEMRGPQILERVNAFYGYRAVARLRVTQSGAAPGLAEAAAPFEGTAVTEADAGVARRRAAALAGAVRNPALRAALTQLGAYVLAQNGGPGRR